MAKSKENKSKKEKIKEEKPKKVKKEKKSDPEESEEVNEKEVVKEFLADTEDFVSEESEDDEPQKKDTPAYDPAEASRTVFVGNVPVNTKKSHLKTFFRTFGTIKTVRLRTFHGQKIQNCRQIKNHPCITAYVVFDTDEAAIGAQEASGKMFRNAHIRVMMADGKKKYYDGKRTVFVGNLTYAVTDDDLYEVFQSCGEIKYVRTLRNPMGCKGTAYVCFKNPESVGLALELNQTMMNDRPIRVERYKAKPKVKNEVLEKGRPGKKFAKKKEGKPEGFRVKKDVKRLQDGKKPFTKKLKTEEKSKKSPRKVPETKNKAKKNKKHRTSVNMKLAKKLNPQLKKKSQSKE